MQAKLGAKNAAAYDVFAACTGFIYALGLARGVIGTGIADNVLVIGVEQLSRIVDCTDRNTCVLFGDGAGAAVLRACAPGEGILGGHDRTATACSATCSRCRPAASARPASHETVDERGHFIKMRGKELFKVAVRGMEESLRQALDERGRARPADLDLVIPHQANLRIIEAARERLGIPTREGRAQHRPLRQHLRPPRSRSALDEVVRAGRLAPGDHVAFVAFGGGATWGATVSRWTLPVQSARHTEVLTPAEAPLS